MGGPDADGVRRYRLSLAVEARRFKRYPPRAREENIAGTAEIRVSVAAGGIAQEVRLAQSSGHDMLDEAALDMVTKAVPRASVPEGLRDKAFVVSLPVVFDLVSD